MSKLNSNIVLSVHFAMVVVGAELAWRSAMYFFANHTEQFSSTLLLLLCSYMLCLIVPTFDLKNSRLLTGSLVRNFLSICHALDGASAFCLGVGMLLNNSTVVVISILVMTKFGLLSLFNRMVLGKAVSDDWMDSVDQTTKSFLHHAGSFLFLSRDPREIWIITVWRSVSMTSHALLVLRKRVSPQTVSTLQWIVAYFRLIFLLGMVVLTIWYYNLALLFGKSVAGHLAYLSVRATPLFQQGAVYTEHSALIFDGKRKFYRPIRHGDVGEPVTYRSSVLSDSDRLSLLMRGNYPLLSLELVLMGLLSVLWVWMRIHNVTLPMAQPTPSS